VVIAAEKFTLMPLVTVGKDLGYNGVSCVFQRTMLQITLVNKILAHERFIVFLT